jgi:hypothetical protein
MAKVGCKGPKNSAGRHCSGMNGEIHLGHLGMVRSRGERKALPGGADKIFDPRTAIGMPASLIASRPTVKTDSTPALLASMLAGSETTNHFKAGPLNLHGRDRSPFRRTTFPCLATQGIFSAPPRTRRAV